MSIGADPGTQPIYRVLLVEDDASSRRSLSRLLELTGFAVAAAADARAALEYLEQNARPDLLLTDLQLPGMDGVGLIQRARAIHADLPVVVMTGSTSEESHDALDLAGVDLQLLKPLSVASMAERFRELIERRRRGEG